MIVESYKIGCKVNLFLHIVGRRENGYHELNSLFYPLPEPFDQIDILHPEDDKQELVLTCSNPLLDLENNTLTKTYKLFREETAFSPSIHLHLTKGIPQGAGLGGGSADAAFLLKYLYKKWKQKETLGDIENKDKNLLEKIALKVGADVPFFLENKAMHVEGIGEKLATADVSPLKGSFLLLLCPKIEVSTIRVFQAFREENPYIEKKIKKISTENLTSALNQAIKPNDAGNKFLFRNDLEQVVFSFFPLLKEYKEKLLELHASVALMSGSGASLFGLFSAKEKAEIALAYFEKDKDVQVFPCVML